MPDGDRMRAEVGGGDDGVGGVATGDEGCDFVKDGATGWVLLLEPAEAREGFVSA